mmetsp:Transcript_62594/g.104184  ORF Transcript_62594/g.104184 Transcript_62594/m.104184 type:complete len:254 (-) Transcript_62594:317-1078(-)
MLSTLSKVLSSHYFPCTPPTAKYMSTVAVPKVAVVLAGCGVYDGAECTEATSTLIHLSSAGAEYACFAPNKDQFHVIDHTKGEELAVPRNVLVEAARIARGVISPLDEIKPAAFDALVIPGGFGAAKNLCNHATVAQGDASKLEVDPDVKKTLLAFHEAGKPIGLCCIAPVIAASVLKCTVTVGQAEGNKWPYGGTVGAIENYGGKHQSRGIDGVCVDATAKVVTSPAYMYEGRPHEIYNSVGLMVKETLKLI